MTDKLIKLLAEGKTYFWAIRQAQLEDAVPLSEHGIDDDTLDALRALEHGVARFPHPTAKRADHVYFPLSLPPDVTVYFAPMINEYSIETGTELFPNRTHWQFPHTEIQYCTGGQTPMSARLIHGAEESKHVRTGDVMLIPDNTTLTYHSSEENGYGHAHIFVMNHSNRPLNFYDGLPRMKLAYRELAGGTFPEPIHLDQIAHRIEVTDWSELVSPRAQRSEQLPTWLRNGWAARETTRALDYAEGTKSLVINSPDREPEDYLEWGVGKAACRVNPIVAEAEAAITDCVFPAGWAWAPSRTELWTVLRGSALVWQSLAPIHRETSESAVSSGSSIVVPGGGRVEVREASDDLVVRRLASTCAHNGHWAMMEAKLVADGLAGRA